LRKLTILQLVNKIPHLVVYGGSLPHLKEHATCPYPELDQLSPHLTSHFLNTHFNNILPSTADFPSGLFPTGFPHKNPKYLSPHPIRVTCSTHLIILGLITRMMFVEVFSS